MAKTHKTAPKTEAPTATEAPMKAVGPKGVKVDAVITLVATSNPKREGSAAKSRFAAYTDQMTVADALAAGLTTPDLVYDAKHGFIQIDGYSVPGGVTVPKVKAPPKPKAEKKEKKEKAAKVEKTEEQKDLEAQADAEATAETME